MAAEIRRGGARDIGRLEPLWVAVHHRHAESMPELAPYVSDATTWAERRALYEQLLAKPGTVLLLACDGDGLVGYGLAHVLPLAETWIGDTWVTGERIGEIESVAVLPEHRGQGIGTRPLEELEAVLAADGVEDLILGVLPGNDAAIRLYERRGYRPTWLYLSRLQGRPATLKQKRR
jgi:ribosomal protein S18 acetylase RimI-like enzyme